jgi:D-sedoheptulose 7-phosphate isomerase
MKEFAKAYLEEEKKIFDDVPLANLEEAIKLLQVAYQDENQIFVMGNGGSGSTASHFACDINKGTCCHLNKRFRVVCLNDNVPTMLAYANDMSYDEVFVEQLKNFVRSGDVVIGISGSGNSRNVIKALEYANASGARSVAFTGFDGGQLAKVASVSVVIPSNDMQKVEDVHLILTHIIMQILCDKVTAMEG